jgi:drug/metabolite transporter (DMT)-like permease
MIVSYFFILFAIILTGFCQILLKIGSNYKKSNKFLDSYLNIATISAYFFYIIITILYTYAMVDLPLKIVYTLGALNYLIILFLSGIILKEPITKTKVIATLFIAIGIIIFNF